VFVRLCAGQRKMISFTTNLPTADAFAFPKSLERWLVSGAALWRLNLEIPKTLAVRGGSSARALRQITAAVMPEIRFRWDHGLAFSSEVCGI
jgi:hypothetical protein